MEKHVSLVLLHKDGMELIVLIDVLMEEYGMLLHKAVFAQPVNSGMDMPVLSALTERPGMLILKIVNVQSHQLGMELPVLFVQVEEFITMLPTNANAQVVKPIMDMSVLLTAQLVNSITKL